ncbi:beta-propeller domain-containing protein [Brevibacillus agri]|uniref:beta-propeller domain-containing protein n=1 Tax=Brevibacillus agri TaxID=51101 RepID=UPI002E21966B|nr:beta-propeller domain-containing protein [Brevibacillus agri]
MKKKAAGLIVTAVVLCALPFLLPPGSLNEPTVTASEQDGLPVVGSYGQFKKLLKKAKTNYVVAEAELSMPAAAAVLEARDSGESAAAPDFSATNTQVQGVDEADIVKTDGTYLYQSTSREVRIVKAYPASEMRMTSRISYEDGLFTPLEMFVDDKKLIVIGQANSSVELAPLPASKRAIPYYRHNQLVKALVYDIQDKAQPRLIRQLEVEGQYLSSRKIGSSLYLTANHYIDTYRILQEKTELPGPAYRDSAFGEQYQTVPYSDIRYFPESLQPNYLMVAGVNLDEPKQKLSLSTYLGAGENIYASPTNLYVAVTEHKAEPIKLKQGESLAPSFAPPPLATDTTIYRFGMNDGKIAFSAKGSVPGQILNQFSLDEHDGYLRIGTTSGNMWRTDSGTSQNNVYVLDSTLGIHGKLEGIAPTERIYSVRFMGKRAYMVTFRNVDPLFVLDLAKPAAPRILGALKIPGYSDYLHPYDENHIIGFGKEAESDKDMAFYQGMKIALFDVSDVTKPKEKFKTVIGDRGTDSELLRNHKALLFSKEKGLLAFPVTVYEWTEEQKAKQDIRGYGHFTFQGAYVYRLDLEKGFTLTDKITHLEQADRDKAGEGWYESTKNIKRILTIDQTLYTVSDDFVKAQPLQGPKAVKTLPLTK